jgi:aspartyl protease family protein
MRLLLLLTVCAGLALGLFWPGEGRVESPPSPSQHEVTVDRSSDGHFYVEVLVDEKPVRFLVDTGASAVTLTPEDARKLGIEVKKGEYELIGQGASGIVRGKFVDVASIQLGEFRQTDAKVAVVQGSSVSLLGQPFLEQLDEIVIRKDVMLLRSGSGS